MHYLNTFIVFALASLAYAQSKTLYFLSLPSLVEVGQPVLVKYIAPTMSEPVKIVLRKGEASNLDTVATLTGSALGGTYTWTPSEALRPGADYALEIVQGQDINYTNQFTISGASPAPLSYTEDAKSASAGSAKPTLSFAAVPPGKSHVTIKAMTTASAGTIPISRNTTFVSPTLKPTRPANPTLSPTLGGGTSSPTPTGNAATGLRGQLPLVVAAAAVALACLC